MQQKYTNIAFISYKREDEKWAKWLQTKLEHYKLPTEIRKQNPDLEFAKNPRHVFKDTTDLSGGVLAKAIKEGLDSSKFLIVICSPRAAKSEWVCKEVQDFINSGREEYIIPFIIDGEPYAKIPDNECFPAALKPLAGERELLGININENGRESAAIKVIARIFDVRFDALWDRFQREEKKRRRRIFAAFIVAIIFLLCVIAGGAYAYSEIQKERDRAELETKRANEEKERVTQLNKQLASANDRISKQKTSLQKAYDDLGQSNKHLVTERNNARRANAETLLNYSKFSALLSLEQIENGNIIPTRKQILRDMVSNAKNVPSVYCSDLEYALRTSFTSSLPSDIYIPIGRDIPNYLSCCFLDRHRFAYGLSEKEGILNSLTKIQILDLETFNTQTIDLPKNDFRVDLRFFPEEDLIAIGEDSVMLLNLRNNTIEFGLRPTLDSIFPEENDLYKVEDRYEEGKHIVVNKITGKRVFELPITEDDFLGRFSNVNLFKRDNDLLAYFPGGDTCQIFSISKGDKIQEIHSVDCMYQSTYDDIIHFGDIFYKRRDLIYAMFKSNTRSYNQIPLCDDKYTYLRDGYEEKLYRVYLNGNNVKIDTIASTLPYLSNISDWETFNGVDAGNTRIWDYNKEYHVDFDVDHQKITLYKGSKNLPIKLATNDGKLEGPDIQRVSGCFSFNRKYFAFCISNGYREENDIFIIETKKGNIIQRIKYKGSEPTLFFSRDDRNLFVCDDIYSRDYDEHDIYNIIWYFEIPSLFQLQQTCEFQTTKDLIGK